MTLFVLKMMITLFLMSSCDTCQIKMMHKHFIWEHGPSLAQSLERGGGRVVLKVVAHSESSSTFRGFF